MKKLNKYLPYIVILIFVGWIVISTNIKNRQISKLQKELYQSELSKDTLSNYINELTQTNDSLLVYMDSIYKLSKQSKDEEIKNYWDSVYNNLINNPNADFLSEYLKDLGK